MEKKVASNKILWIFAIGQLGWSMLSGIVNNWLVFFYQPSQVELANGQVEFIPQVTLLGIFTILGLISAIGRVFDAGTDPLIAGKSDSLKHKLGRRIPFMRFAAIPASITEDVCKLFTDLIGIHTIALPNYLSVTLTPSNPILHTSRLYGLFHDYHEGMTWDEPLSFYKNMPNP